MSTQSVSITLPSPIIYVTGTVNGATVTFSLSGTNTWTAVCAASEDDVYDVAIQACDAAGNTTNYNITIYYGLQLITNRTGGYYNASDLNRVGYAMAYVRDRLAEYGYSANISPKLDYSMQDIPRESQMAQYISDVNALRDSFVVFQTTPPMPADMVRLTYTEANNIEKILRDIDSLITLMVAEFKYSGEVFAGEM